MLSACNANKEEADNSSLATEIPFAVGSTTFFVHDSTRPYDSVGGIDDGTRILITEVWYPVDHATIANNRDEYRVATYGDYVFGDRDMHRLMMTNTTFFHLTPDTVLESVTTEKIDAAIEELFNRERKSFIDAPLATSAEPLPVIVMTHGDAGSRYNMESACEYLAAHGYVVIAPEHTGNSPYSLTGRDPALDPVSGDAELRASMANVMQHFSPMGAYGSEETYGQTYIPSGANVDPLAYLKGLDAALLQRLSDLRATIDELERMNEDGFARGGPGKLDLSKIGLMGRSFGGASTMVGLAMEPRITAGFAVVPPGWADPRPTLPSEALAAPGEESVLFAREGAFPLTTISKPTVLLSGAEDGLIIGLGKRVAEMGGAPAPTAAAPHPLMRAAYEETSAPVVWGLLEDSNHSTFGVSGGYWWPDLKPNSQSKTFNPNVRFQLISPHLAHKMQQELALAFFDVTIRADDSAKERLLNNRYRDDGLILESRNFEI
ncbi:MAG: acetylhydrolase [Woeseia sp.]|nr:acetylhydrolase [Woeseia sp.]